MFEGYWYGEKWIWSVSRAFHKWDFNLRYLDKIDRNNGRIYTSAKGMKHLEIPWLKEVVCVRGIIEKALEGMPLVSGF